MAAPSIDLKCSGVRAFGTVCKAIETYEPNIPNAYNFVIDKDKYYIHFRSKSSKTSYVRDMRNCPNYMELNGFIRKYILKDNPITLSRIVYVEGRLIQRWHIRSAAKVGSSVKSDEEPAKPPVRLDEKPAKPSVRLDEKPAKPPVRLDEKPAKPSVRLDEKPAKPSVRLDEKPAKPSVKSKNGSSGENPKLQK
ncbi:hypothetical protein B7494_g2144 [Chlorociboria aeruginascens]|nr:hypothetical protein B7494_g2144 [Chlorociboria aeruginascens]